MAEGDGEIRIGILSDTHGQAARTARAAGLLADRGVRRVIHCGDIGGDAVVDALAGMSVTYVFGNMDFDRPVLRRYIRALGGTVGEPFARIEIAGRRVAAIHGDDARTLDRLIHAEDLDYVFHGHTHVAADRRVGRTRVINPGALHRARPHTVAVLDPASGELELIEVPG